MINKLVDKIKKTNAPVVVGLDPMLKYIPEHIKKAAFSQYGETLEGAAEAVWQFMERTVFPVPFTILKIHHSVQNLIEIWTNWKELLESDVSPIMNHSLFWYSLIWEALLLQP